MSKAAENMGESAGRKSSNRIASIQDPVQRSVAKRLGEVCDLFSERFATLAPSRRFVAQPGSANAGGRVRNAMRPLVVGMAIRLLDDLGAPLSAMHGREAQRGRTEIAELADLHPQTILQCEQTFVALLEDRSEIGRLVAQRYAQILDACKRDAGKAIRPAPERARVSVTRSKVRKATKRAVLKTFKTKRAKAQGSDKRKAKAKAAKAAAESSQTDNP